MRSAPPASLDAVPSFKTAYLIHGDDHGRISERRAKLRAMAESEAGTAGVEVFEGDQCTPGNIAAALSTMTFAMGRRFVIADGVERWKDAEVEPVAQALPGLNGPSGRVGSVAKGRSPDEALLPLLYARQAGSYRVLTHL